MVYEMSMRRNPVSSSVYTDFLLGQFTRTEAAVLIDAFGERIGPVSVDGVPHGDCMHISGCHY